jgi:hypothetical protein
MLKHEVVTKKYRLPNPKGQFSENSDLLYEKILLNCWSENPVLRPRFSYLNEIFYNYFDVIEPDYDFDKQIIENDVKDYNSLFDEVNEINADEVNMGVLISSGNYSEIWKGMIFRYSCPEFGFIYETQLFYMLNNFFLFLFHIK